MGYLSISLSLSAANFRICGALFNAGANPQTTHATACTFAAPFKVMVTTEPE